MDEQNGESDEEEVMGEGMVSWEWRNWYQNEVNDLTMTTKFRRTEMYAGHVASCPIGESR